MKYSSNKFHNKLYTNYIQKLFLNLLMYVTIETSPENSENIQVNVWITHANVEFQTFIV